MRVDEFAELAGVRVEDDTLAAIDTLGGLVVALLGRFPAVGEQLTIDGRRLRVERLDGLRVAAVRLLPKQARPQGD
jgi:CBS domain containing-hemolysin-like protein